MIKESTIDVNKIWYLGNNRNPNLRIVQPAWDFPFFLTDNIKYAEDYADYGIYKVILKGEINSNILDFDNDEDVSKLKWPALLISKIREGKNDLNSLAYDMYELAFGSQNIMYIEKSNEWTKISDFFKKKVETRKSIQHSKSHWADERDYSILLEMWKDIHAAGFNGFTHTEFGNKIIALFSICDIKKICINKITKKCNC